MKKIKLNLSDEKTLEMIKDFMIMIICVVLLITIAEQVELQEQHEQIKTRYEQIKQDNTKLMKENDELIERIEILTKEADLQPNIVNNRDTRY